VTTRFFVDAFWLSPWGAAVFVALRHKGVPFETVEVALHARQQREEPYRERLSTGRIPCLEHEGLALTESSAIVEYLEERFPPPAHPALLPREAAARGKARQLMAWVRSDLFALKRLRNTLSYFYGVPHEQELDAAARRDAERLLWLAERWISSNGQYLFGDWTIADIDLGLMLKRLTFNRHEVSAKVERYVDRVWAHPALKEYAGKERKPFQPFEGGPTPPWSVR